VVIRLLPRFLVYGFFNISGSFATHVHDSFKRARISRSFGDGEEITNLAAERTWISVSGFKGDRLFYRRAALACVGDLWHQIAFEFPAKEKRDMQDFIKRAVEKLNDGENEGCEMPLSKSAKDGEPHSAEQSSPAQ
jgi:hypothetical protein